MVISDSSSAVADRLSPPTHQDQFEPEASYWVPSTCLQLIPASCDLPCVAAWFNAERDPFLKGEGPLATANRRWV